MKDGNGKPSLRMKSWGLLSSPHTYNFKGNSNSSGLQKNAYVVIAALFTVFVLLNPGSISSSSRSAPATSADQETAIDHSVEKSSRKSLTWSLAKSSPDNPLALGPKIRDLDGQRNGWWKANSDFRTGRPKILIVTGSQPAPCEHSIETHLLLKAAKNKIHYSRKHDFQMHYSLVEPASAFNGSSWAKLAVLRMLIAAHPEVEWFWWMDGTTVVTDTDFDVPLDRYQNHNFVIHGDEHRVFSLKDWEGLFTGNFLIRNCQWSIEFLDAWGSMGPASSRQANGKVLSDSLHGRPQGMDADDQSALVYLLTTKKKVWASKVFLEEIPFSGSWTNLYNNLELADTHGRTESFRPAVVTHFSGCFRCDGKSNADSWVWERCRHAMEHALDYADNQIYRQYGYELRELGVPRLDPIPGFTVKGVVASSEQHFAGEFHGFPFHKLPGPPVRSWDAQREDWFWKNPGTKKTNELGLPKTMIVTGSSISECPHREGAQFLLQALKNKVDYARFHDMQMFYGMVDFDRDMDFWWTKIPTIRVLMLAHPDVEWFWWCDGDAVITDMIFEVPFEQFKDYNLVLYGEHDLVYKKHDWIGLNAGIYLIRNCQWTLDLFDIWAALGARESRTEAGRIQTEVLVDRPVMDADDQSALIYILINDVGKLWSPYIRLEEAINLSGNWRMTGPRLEQIRLKTRPGTGKFEWPWITHFAGCQPCGSVAAVFEADKCNLQIRRAHDFADDQVLSLYGLEHVSLGNPQVRSNRRRSSSRQ